MMHFIFWAVAALSLMTVYGITGRLLQSTPLMKKRKNRLIVMRAILINIGGFLLIYTVFKWSYGYVADDVNYYGKCLDWGGRGLGDVHGGSAFMWFISKPLRQYFGFTLETFHALYFALGFWGSLNYLRALALIHDFKIVTNVKLNELMILTMLCFPNFLAWGRFYGKDSLVYFLVSFIVFNGTWLIKNEKIDFFKIAAIALAAFFVSYIRPHVAGAAIISLIIGYVMAMMRKKIKRGGTPTFIRVIVVPVLIAAGGMIITFAFQRTTGHQEFSVGGLEQSLTTYGRMGAYGGSSTAYAEVLEENERLVLNPVVVSMNVLTLMFAPMPWQVRNPRDILALISNLFLAYLIFKHWRTIRMQSNVQVYFLAGTIIFAVMLSFMGANVGLLLRQKTIMLPFIFLLIFSGIAESDLHTLSLANKKRARRRSVQSLAALGNTP